MALPSLFGSQEAQFGKTVRIDLLSGSKQPIVEITSLEIGTREGNKMWQIKTVVPWAHKFATRALLLTSTATMLAFLAFVATVNAQVAISITPPVCAYGYYGYAPYGCAPSGYYGPGYFYGGVFLGVGPWANWGYGHGWGEHRFSGGGGGRYVGGHAYAGNRGGGVAVVHASGSRGNSPAARSHAAAAHGGASHGASHAAAGHGGASHGASHAPA
jgi:hypothetical protein